MVEVLESSVPEKSHYLPHNPVTDLHKLRARYGSGEQKLWDTPDFSGAQILFDLQIYSQTAKTMNKL